MTPAELSDLHLELLAVALALLAAGIGISVIYGLCRRH